MTDPNRTYAVLEEVIETLKMNAFLKKRQYDFIKININ